ncbi:DNA translocase FtsK [Caminibacter pacificus]|uniref:DNA translocase FtsK n=1 Tax=Caminibacter pacificus TaxID=1424653 RepID=A0ABX5TLR5_9BACT|nr:DNA translocase FtsK [Caminibacter pacificus]
MSTFLPSASVVGKFGKFLGDSNLLLFGFLAYLDILFFAWILYLWFFNKFNTQNSLRALGIIFLFLGFLIFQALIFQKGVIGNVIAVALKKYIGILGVALLGFVILAWGGFLIFEEKIFEYIHKKRAKKEENDVSINENANIESKESLEFEEDDFEEENIQVFEQKEDFVENIDEKVTKSDNDEDVLETLKESLDEEDLKPAAKKAETKKKKETKDNFEDIAQKIEDKNEHKVTQVQELEDTKKLLSEIEIGEREKPRDWKFPPLDILQKPPKKKREINEAEIDKKIKILLEKLKQFKVEGDVVRYYVGPVVTTFEFKPLPHIKVSKILSLQDDLAMALKAKSIRIQAPIPGKDVVGIEIPNDKMETIYLREILESDIFKKSKSPLTLALGKDIVGAPFVTDLAKLPHLLIAGTTGSGKSVGINAMILSLLYKNSPDELKFVMIDPKMLEFSIYEDIPHLLTPVITESKKAIVALNAMVKEMERRYKLMAKKRVKNIEGYNKKVDKNEKLPYIVIIIDELADLMMTSGKDVEYAIARLAQMARASGIHLIVATQRPSVDVVTGLIKANLPSRISFKVGQKVDSKVILDQYGAESLLGRGDMLFTPPGIAGLLRLHAPFTTEEEIEKVVEYLKSQRQADYDNTIINTIESEAQELEEVEDLDELFEEAKKIILKERRTSISYLQRRLQIGYNRAANIIEQMERMGILSPPNAKGQREILI